MQTAGLRARIGIAAALCCLFVLAMLFGRWCYATCDDTFIFLVYARNLVEGNGLTFNGTRVEGFTSVSWMILLSLAGLAGASLLSAAELLSTASGLVAIIATYWLGRRFGLDRVRSIIPAALLSATGDFAFYLSVGLEQCLFVGLVAWGGAEALRPRALETLTSLRFPMLMAAMILTRPEGALLAALLLCFLAYRSQSLVAAIRCGLVLTAMLAPFMVARRLYYGYWLPNTYSAKSGAGLANLPRGLRYLDHAWPRYALVLGCMILAILWKTLQHRRREIVRTVPFLVLTLVWCAYVAVRGGDNMVGARALLPLLPLLYVLTARLARHLPTPLLCFATILVCVASVVAYRMDDRLQRHADSWRTSTKVRTRVAGFLRDNFPADTLIALSPCGIVPYITGFPTIDTLGLNDVHIARHGRADRKLPYGHQVGDGYYVLSREPDVILFYSGDSLKPGPYVSDQEIWNSPEFRANYLGQRWPGVGFGYVLKP